MAKLENVKILDMVNGEPTRVEYDGEVYVKTEDDAKAGDLVRVIDAFYITCVEEGGFYDIFDRHDLLMFLDDDGDFRPYKLNRRGFETFRKVSETKASADLAERLAELERRLEALEEITKGEAAAPEAELKVGDYAKVIPHDNDIYFGGKPGDIVKIIDVSDDRYRTEELDGGNYNDNPWVKKEGLVRATAEEVEQALRWAKIGRKPGEFKKGDFVKLTLSDGRIYYGEIDGQNTSFSDVRYFFKDHEGDVSTELPDNLTLIAPVGQRFDLAAEGARQ
jgi:hypothetical protein